MEKLLKEIRLLCWLILSYLVIGSFFDLLTVLFKG